LIYAVQCVPMLGCAAPPMATMLPRYCRGDSFERYLRRKIQRRRQKR
jgi:hypothetical protein